MILAMLVGSQICIIPVNSESDWLKGLGGDSNYCKLFTLFYFKLGQPFCSSEKISFSCSDRRSSKQHSYEVQMKSARWYRKSSHFKTFLF